MISWHLEPFQGQAGVVKVDQVAKGGHVEVVKMLLEYGVNIEEKAIWEYTVLDLARTESVVRLPE